MYLFVRIGYWGTVSRKVDEGFHLPLAEIEATKILVTLTRVRGSDRITEINGYKCVNFSSLSLSLRSIYVHFSHPVLLSKPRNTGRYLHTINTTRFSRSSSSRGKDILQLVFSKNPTDIYLIWTSISMPQIMDEETPLLGEQSQNSQQNNPKKQKTPLPWRQFSILLLLQVSEPITSQVITPFLPQV